MRSTSSGGAAYFAETTSSCVPGMYSAATKAPGVAGSGAATESSFAASSVCTSCLAMAADLDSWADAVGVENSAAPTTPVKRATAGRPDNRMVDLALEDVMPTF